MNKIDLEKINFSVLRRINCDFHNESDLYYDNDVVYKIFKPLSTYNSEKKQKKIEMLLDGVALPNVVMPIDEISFNRAFIGYTMEHIKDSIALGDIKKRSKDINLFFHIVSIISNSLEQIHGDPRKILVGDLHFDNIIIDNSFNPYFIDFDSCQIDGLINEQIPAILSLYLSNRGLKPTEINANTDKFNLLLSTLYTIFNRTIDRISLYQYDKVAEKSETLKNLRNIVLEAKKSKYIPEVPYLHEMIIPSKKEIIHTRKRI